MPSRSDLRVFKVASRTQAVPVPLTHEPPVRDPHSALAAPRSRRRTDSTGSPRSMPSAKALRTCAPNRRRSSGSLGDSRGELGGANVETAPNEDEPARMTAIGVLPADYRRPLLAYSVEKLEINGDAISRLCERTTFDSFPTCVQTDARARREAAATNKCPLVSRNLGRL
jgi:hypothetical protein